MDGFENDPVYLLDRAGAWASGLIRDAAKAADLPVPEARVLLVLHRTGKAWRISRLADAALLQQPTTSKTVHQLAEAGLLVRTPAPSDRRGVELTLSPAGAARAAVLARSLGAGVEELLSRCPAFRKQAVVEALRSFGGAGAWLNGPKKPRSGLPGLRQRPSVA